MLIQAVIAAVRARRLRICETMTLTLHHLSMKMLRIISTFDHSKPFRLLVWIIQQKLTGRLLTSALQPSKHCAE
jgi:hypothetical protein